MAFFICTMRSLRGDFVLVGRKRRASADEVAVAVHVVDAADLGYRKKGK